MRQYLVPPTHATRVVASAAYPRLAWMWTSGLVLARVDALRAIPTLPVHAEVLASCRASH